MGFIQSVKNLFKKGGYALTGETLKSINDHEKINIDPEELARIERNFREYGGKYDQVGYVNTMGDAMKRDYMHLNMVEQSANLLAGLVFNEQCEVVVSDEDKEKKRANSYESANDLIQHIFEHNDFKKNLMRYLEPMYAIGGLAVRPYVDNATGNIEYAWALANAFYPLKSNSNGISEGVIKSVTMKVVDSKQEFYTLLEFHEWMDGDYVITNELYKSDDQTKVGKRVPLSDLFEDLEEQSYIENLTRPLFNYLKPSGFNNVNPHSPLGLGITDNSKPTLKQINDTFDQFNWEIKMGQRTVFVSDFMLQTLPSEDGKPPKQIFDPDTNVYKSMRMAQDEEMVKDVTSDIRTEQYVAAINQSFKTLEMQLQVSSGTFSFDGQSVKTATEIVSENSLTYRTRNNQVNEVEKFIKGLIISTLELAQATTHNGVKLFTGEIPKAEHIGVDFDDGIFVDKEAQLKFYGDAKTFGLIPSTEVIQRLFKVPEETAIEWVTKIHSEQMGTDPGEFRSKKEKEEYGDEE